MTLNGVMAVTLSYFTEFGKPVLQHITASIRGASYARLLYFVVRVRCRRKKFTFAISSPDKFLVLLIIETPDGSWKVLCFTSVLLIHYTFNPRQSAQAPRQKYIRGLVLG